MKINYVIRLFTMFYLCFCCIEAQAQFTDRIVKKDSTELYVMVEATEGDSITYRFYGQPQDSIYALPKSAINKIVLRNGGGVYRPKTILHNANGIVKPPKISSIYVDAAAGLTLELAGMADLSVGYRFNEKQAIGISYIAMSNYSIDAMGVGAQWRFTPQRKSLFKLELGVITSADSIDRSGPEIYTYQPKNASNLYLRVGLAVKVTSFFSLGINYVGTSPMTFLISGQNIAPNRRS
jgi:hypothetical protein